MTSTPPPQSMQMAVVVVALLPILMVYPFLQKHFNKGVITGAIKGYELLLHTILKRKRFSMKRSINAAGFSRRSFLGLAGISVAAVALTGTLSACSSGAKGGGGAGLPVAQAPHIQGIHRRHRRSSGQRQGPGGRLLQDAQAGCLRQGASR